MLENEQCLINIKRYSLCCFCTVHGEHLNTLLNQNNYCLFSKIVFKLIHYKDDTIFTFFCYKKQIKDIN